MRIRLAASACGNGSVRSQYLTSILINDTVAIDAGCLGFLSDLAAQKRVRHVLISHSHNDHVASLPIFLENVYTGDEECVRVYTNETVRQTLQTDLFNDRIWPDFIALSKTMPPFLRFESMEAEKPIRLDGLTITPVIVEHIVPTFGFIVEDDAGAIVIATDTGPTERLWKKACEVENLRAVLLDCSFPEELTGLAHASQHLTPALFDAEAWKLKREGVRWIAVHIKAFCRDAVVTELEALDRKVEIAEPGREYDF